MQDTAVFVNMWSFHNDIGFWGDPEKFRPERFLDEKGQLLKDYSLPFGAGQCFHSQSEILHCDLLSCDTLYTKIYALYLGDLRFISWLKIGYTH
jgi:hypothetical protein